MMPDDFDWTAHTEFMMGYARRLANGAAEDIPPLEPLKWWQGPRWDVPASSGYYGAWGCDYSPLGTKDTV